MSTTDKTRRASGGRGEGGDGRSKKREREIIDAAAEIFHRKGYSETSVQDVADAVGILKGSLYYYIDSKEDLLFRMLLEVHEDASGIVRETSALDAPPLRRLRVYIEKHVEFNAHNLAKMAVYYHDFGLLSPKRKKAILDQRAFYQDFVIGLIKEAQETGEVDPTIDAMLVSNGIFGLVNWIYTWYKPGGPVTTSYLGKLYAEMVVSGITGKNMPQPEAGGTRRNSTRRRSR